MIEFEDDGYCHCIRKAGEWIPVEDVKKPICPQCGYKIMPNNIWLCGNKPQEPTIEYWENLYEQEWKEKTKYKEGLKDIIRHFEHATLANKFNPIYMIAKNALE